MNKFFVSFGLLGAVLAMAGCSDSGPKLVPAEGTVTLGGAPLAGAMITVHYADKNLASGRSDNDGKFSLVYGNGKIGAVPGTSLKVTVTKQASAYEGVDPDTVKVKDEFSSPDYSSMKDKIMSMSGPGKGPPKVTNELPAKYSDPMQSELKIDIPAGGKKDLKIELS